MTRYSNIPKSRVTEKPDNPFDPASTMYALFEGDFSGMPVPEIADYFDELPQSIYSRISIIQRRTGWKIPYRKKGHGGGRGNRRVTKYSSPNV